MSYNRDTRFSKDSKVQCLSVDIRVGCAGECDHLTRPACAQAQTTLESPNLPGPVEGRGSQAQMLRVKPKSTSGKALLENLDDTEQLCSSP